MMLLVLIIAGLAFAQETPYPVQYWVYGKVTIAAKEGETPPALMDLKATIHNADKTLVIDEALVDSFGLYHSDLLFKDFKLPPGTYYVSVAKTNGWGADPVAFDVGAAAGSNMVDLSVEYGKGPEPQPQPGTGPEIKLTVYLQGYFDAGTKKQKPATVVVEARSGAGPAEAKTIAGSCEIALDENGTGSNTGNWASTPALGQNYYLVVKQKLAGTPPGPNHLPIITAKPIANLQNQIYNVNLSDANNVYPAGALINGAMRGGDADGNGIIQPADVSTWYKDLNKNGNFPGDYDGNGIVQPADHSIWYSNLNQTSSVPAAK